MPSVARRLVDAVVLLWLVASLTFALIHLAPGDPAALLIAPSATADDVQRQRELLGLNTSLPVQYVRWLGGVLRGDLGTSLVRSQPVRAIIGEALPISLWLGGLSLLISFVFGIALGMFQALRASRRIDTTLTVLSTGLYAAPSFWLALALVVAATSGAAWIGVPGWLRLPAFGMYDPAATPDTNTLWDLLRHSVLPLLVLSVPGAAGVARYARQSLRDASVAPHVQTALARGVPRATAERRYVLRNALTPLVVLAGLTLPGIIAGSVFVEQVFAWPGLGRTMVGAIAGRDYPVVLGLTLVYAAVVITSNVVADLTLLRLDPRRHLA